MPQVAAPARFASGLPGTQGLPPIVQPLGHEVSALATPGLVVAHARPVAVAAAGSIPAPVQRRAARGSKGAGSSPAPAQSVPDVIEHDAHDSRVATSATPLPEPPAPIRSMPTVSRSAVRVPDRPLTSAAAAARPAALQRAAATVAAYPGAAPSGPLPPPVPTGMRRAPSSVQRAEAAAPAALASSATPPPAGGRSGLGEPMTTLPASARPIAAPGPVISRSTTTGPMPAAAASLRAPVQRGAAGGPPSTSSASSAGTTPQGAAAPAQLPELPRLPVARQATSAAPRAAGTSTVAAAVPGSSVPEIRPIAGANPIRTSVALQREAAEDVDGDADEGPTLPSPWWSSSDAAARPVAADLGAGGADAGPASIQRAARHVTSPSAAPTRVPATVADVAHARASVQRTAAPVARHSLPALTLPHAPGRGPSGASPVTADVPAPAINVPARSVISDPVVQTSGTRAAVPGATTAASAGAVVQREGTVSVVAPTPTEPAAPGASVAPSGGGGGQPAQGSRNSERDLDELAMALFGRIRTRLRSDLMHDREAKGLTFDNV